MQSQSQSLVEELELEKFIIDQNGVKALISIKERLEELKQSQISLSNKKEELLKLLNGLDDFLSAYMFPDDYAQLKEAKRKFLEIQMLLRNMENLCQENKALHDSCQDKLKQKFTEISPLVQNAYKAIEDKIEYSPEDLFHITEQLKVIKKKPNFYIAEKMLISYTRLFDKAYRERTKNGTPNQDSLALYDKLMTHFKVDYFDELSYARLYPVCLCKIHMAEKFFKKTHNIILEARDKMFAGNNKIHASYLLLIVYLHNQLTNNTYVSLFHALTLATKVFADKYIFFYYEFKLNQGFPEALKKVGEIAINANLPVLIKKSDAKNNPVFIFYCKTKSGWREITLSIDPNTVILPSLSKDECRQIQLEDYSLFAVMSGLHEPWRLSFSDTYTAVKGHIEAARVKGQLLQQFKFSQAILEMFTQKLVDDGKTREIKHPDLLFDENEWNNSYIQLYIQDLTSYNTRLENLIAPQTTLLKEIEDRIRKQTVVFDELLKSENTSEEKLDKLQEMTTEQLLADLHNLIELSSPKITLYTSYLKTTLDTIEMILSRRISCGITPKDQDNPGFKTEFSALQDKMGSLQKLIGNFPLPVSENKAYIVLFYLRLIAQFNFENLYRNESMIEGTGDDQKSDDANKVAVTADPCFESLAAIKIKIALHFANSIESARYQNKENLILQCLTARFFYKFFTSNDPVIPEAFSYLDKDIVVELYRAHRKFFLETSAQTRKEMTLPDLNIFNSEAFFKSFPEDFTKFVLVLKEIKAFVEDSMTPYNNNHMIYEINNFILELFTSIANAPAYKDKLGIVIANTRNKILNGSIKDLSAKQRILQDLLFVAVFGEVDSGILSEIHLLKSLIYKSMPVNTANVRNMHSEFRTAFEVSKLSPTTIRKSCKDLCVHFHNMYFFMTDEKVELPDVKDKKGQEEFYYYLIRFINFMSHYFSDNIFKFRDYDNKKTLLQNFELLIFSDSFRNVMDNLNFNQGLFIHDQLIYYFTNKKMNANVIEFLSLKLLFDKLDDPSLTNQEKVDLCNLILKKAADKSIPSSHKPAVFIAEIYKQIAANLVATVNHEEALKTINKILGNDQNNHELLLAKNKILARYIVSLVTNFERENILQLERKIRDLQDKIKAVNNKLLSSSQHYSEYNKFHEETVQPALNNFQLELKTIEIEKTRETHIAVIRHLKKGLDETIASVNEQELLAVSVPDLPVIIMENDLSRTIDEKRAAIMMEFYKLNILRGNILEHICKLKETSAIFPVTFTDLSLDALKTHANIKQQVEKALTEFKNALKHYQSENDKLLRTIENYKESVNQYKAQQKIEEMPQDQGNTDETVNDPKETEEFTSGNSASESSQIVPILPVISTKKYDREIKSLHKKMNKEGADDTETEDSHSKTTRQQKKLNKKARAAAAEASTDPDVVIVHESTNAHLNQVKLHLEKVAAQEKLLELQSRIPVFELPATVSFNNLLYVQENQQKLAAINYRQHITGGFATYCAIKKYYQDSYDSTIPVPDFPVNDIDCVAYSDSFHAGNIEQFRQSRKFEFQTGTEEYLHLVYYDPSNKLNIDLSVPKVNNKPSMPLILFHGLHVECVQPQDLKNEDSKNLFRIKGPNESQLFFKIVFDYPGLEKLIKDACSLKGFVIQPPAGKFCMFHLYKVFLKLRICNPLINLNLSVENKTGYIPFMELFTQNYIFDYFKQAMQSTENQHRCFNEMRKILMLYQQTGEHQIALCIFSAFYYQMVSDSVKKTGEVISENNLRIIAVNCANLLFGTLNNMAGEEQKRILINAHAFTAETRGVFNTIMGDFRNEQKIAREIQLKNLRNSQATVSPSPFQFFQIPPQSNDNTPRSDNLFDKP